MPKEKPTMDPTLAQLLQAKAHSDQKRYKYKHKILRQLMQQSPQDWLVDDSNSRFKGVTHVPTGFKLHTHPSTIDPRVQLAQLAKQAALTQKTAERTTVEPRFNFNAAPKPVTSAPAGKFSIVNAGKDFLTAAGLSTLGTTAGLGILGIVAKRLRLPMVSSLFNNAAKESLLFFNPVRSYKLLKRMPEASRLSAKQLTLADDALMNPQTMTDFDALLDSHRLSQDIRSYFKQHNEMPTATLEKSIGVANGLMNLGVGGAVGLAPHTGKLYSDLTQQKQAADAYIITGNPDVDTEHSEQYAKFYDAVKKHIESLGLSAELDPGLANTVPPGGKYWIGHSRGGSRLRFAPKGVQTLRLDDYEPADAVAKQKKEYAKLFKELGVTDVADVPIDKRPKPGPEHYTFNPNQQAAITKLLAKQGTDSLQQFLASAQLMGSRGRARKYGRPEPEDRDYDYIAFTDDSQKQQELMQLLRSLNKQGFKLKDRPGGFLTASGQNMDLSVYPTTKQQDIYKAWELQEGGMSKDDAWNQIESITKQANLLAAVKAPFQFVKNTFRPGFATLRQELQNTRRLYPGTVAEGANSAAQKAQNFFNTRAVRGFYNPKQNVAAVNPLVTDPALASQVMRHELRHATQFNAVNPNSLQGAIKNLNAANPGSWQRSLGLYLGEVQSNAAMHRGVGNQMWNAAKFMFDPKKALKYSKNPGYGGWRYGVIHAAPAVAAGGIATAAVAPPLFQGVQGMTQQPYSALQKYSAEKVTAKKKNSVPGLKPDVELQPHQQRVVDRLTEGDRRLLLYHGLGTGKSLSALAAAESAQTPYGVVLPAALKPNFQKEIANFTEASNPEIMSYTGAALGKQFKQSPETLVLDEAHRIRNPDTASSKAIQNLAAKSKNLLLLTGTPITNSPKDLANLLSLLRNENLTPQQFEERFIEYKKVRPGLSAWLQGVKPGEKPVIKNEADLRQMLRGVVDYQPGRNPEGVNVNEQTIRVPLSADQNKLQRAIRTRIPPEFIWKLDKKFPLSRQELANLNSFLVGLRQASLSTLPFRKNKEPLQAFRESGKLQTAFGNLKKTLDTDERKKAIIYSNFISAGLDPYGAALADAKIPYGVYHGGVPLRQRKQILDQYNQGKLRALLLGPAAAEGISTKGTSLIQLLDPHWHESRSSQARGRGLRFDSHADLPEELKNVEVQRYISSSEEPGWLKKMMGYRRERTGDEILEDLAAEKERLNEEFRQVLREEGTKKKPEKQGSFVTAALAKLVTALKV